MFETFETIENKSPHETVRMGRDKITYDLGRGNDTYICSHHSAQNLMVISEKTEELDENEHNILVVETGSYEPKFILSTSQYIEKKTGKVFYSITFVHGQNEYLEKGVTFEQGSVKGLVLEYHTQGGKKSLTFGWDNNTKSFPGLAGALQ